jgi:hypothetical protein
VEREKEFIRRSYEEDAGRFKAEIRRLQEAGDQD